MTVQVKIIRGRPLKQEKWEKHEDSKKMRPWIAMNNWINLNNHDPWCISDILSIFECFMVLQAGLSFPLSSLEASRNATARNAMTGTPRRGSATAARPGDQHPERLECLEWPLRLTLRRTLRRTLGRLQVSDHRNPTTMYLINSDESRTPESSLRAWMTVTVLKKCRTATNFMFHIYCGMSLSQVFQARVCHQTSAQLRSFTELSTISIAFFGQSFKSFKHRAFPKFQTIHFSIENQPVLWRYRHDLWQFVRSPG